VSEPPDRLPGRRTEPLERPGGSTPRPREPTEPLPASSRPALRRPPSPTRWLLIGLLVLAAAFVVGFVVGRAGGGATSPEGQKQGQGACRRSANLATTLVDLHRQALANRMQFAEAVAREDRDRMDDLDADLETLSSRGERIQERADRVLDRCRS
jgi:hypothetical protein